MQLVIAMVGWVGAGMETVVGRHGGQSQEGLVICGEMLSTYRLLGEDSDATR